MPKKQKEAGAGRRPHAHGEEASEHPEGAEEIRSARELLQSLVKTAKVLKLYLPNNPIHKKFLEELEERFTGHLKTYGDLRLRVKEHRLLSRGQVVYENPQRAESLAFRLFVDGIREMTFQEGLTLEELHAVVRALGGADDHGSDESVATLLWQEEIDHVTYVLVEDLMEVSTSPIREELEEADLGALYSQEVPPGAALTEPVQEVEGAASSSPGEPMLPSAPATVYSLTEDEINRIREEMESEKAMNTTAETLTILLTILEIEKDYEAFNDMVGECEKVLDILLLRGDFSHAAHLLEEVRRLMAPPSDLSERQRERLRAFLVRAGDRERIRMMEEHLKEEREVNQETLLSYLIHLEGAAVRELVSLLGRVEQARARRAICDALVVLGREEVEVLIRRLTDERWFVVRNLVYVLGRIGGPKVMEGLKRLVHHQEPKIRKEVLRALEIMGEEGAQGLLVEFLSDHDPSIRLVAIRGLGSSRYRAALEPLQMMVASEEFEGRDVAEKKEVFEAIARIGHEEVVPYLEKILLSGRRRWWWGRSRGEELAVCAAEALTKIDSPKAFSVLERGSRSAGKAVRAVCLKTVKGAR